MAEAPTRTHDDAARNAPSAELRLKQLEAQFATAERAARIGYWRQDLITQTLTWSPGLFTLLSIEPGLVKPSTEWLMSRIHPDDRAQVGVAVGHAVKEGKPFRYNTRSYIPGEPTRTFTTFGDVERNEAGAIIAIVGTVQEVTEIVAAQDALSRSESAYRFMAQEASDIIARYGHDGRITFISPAVKRVLGLEPEAVLGKGAYDLAHPDDIEQVKAVIAAARKADGNAMYSYRARHKDGHYVWLEAHLRLVTDPASGIPNGAISVSRDITLRKQAEEEVNGARERAEAANRTKSRFLANMSHELRTPLNAIIGFSDILAREMFGPIGADRYQEYAKLINESGTMLLELINDLLDMSKIEAGKFELHHEEFMVDEIIAGCVRLVEKRAEEKNVALKWNTQPANLHMRADQRAIKQILLNLLSNAVKFTPNGGAINVEATKADDAVRLVVRDTGIGIPDHFLPRLARPFEQATNDASRAHGGSGLGLALVKSLTQLHGGEFVIKSKEGHGTEVTVTIPLSPGAVTRAA